MQKPQGVLYTYASVPLETLAFIPIYKTTTDSPWFHPRQFPLMEIEPLQEMYTYSMDGQRFLKKFSKMFLFNISKFMDS